MPEHVRFPKHGAMRAGTHHYVNGGAAWGGYTGHNSHISGAVKLAGYGASEGVGTGASPGVKVSPGLPELVNKYWKQVRSAYTGAVIHPNEVWLQAWEFPARVTKDPGYTQHPDIDMLADADYAAAVFLERAALDYLQVVSELKGKGGDYAEYEKHMQDFEATAKALRASMIGEFEVSDGARNKIKALVDEIKAAAAEPGVPPVLPPADAPPALFQPWYKRPMVLGGIGIAAIALLVMGKR